MAVVDVLRPGFVQLRVMDMAQSLTHYRDRIGLDVVATGADGRVYLKADDEFDHHSIVLRPADTAGMDVCAFKVLDDAALDRLTDRLHAHGVVTQAIPAGEQLGVGRRVRFTAPTGHVFDLYADIERAPAGPMTDNPHVWRHEPRGMAPIRFDHVLLYGDDIDGAADLFTQCLGFRRVEEVETPDGTVLATFLSCSTKSHDIAFVRHAEKGKFHHCSFLLEDWNAIGRAADLMTRYEIPIDIGPTRHGISRGRTIYFFDPSGNRNEVFAGSYDHYPDHPRRVWSADQVGRAIFYYEGELNDRFMGVVT
ncbi:catechol 2,3-dioxygenase [Parapedomonas caeni]